MRPDRLTNRNEVLFRPNTYGETFVATESHLEVVILVESRLQADHKEAVLGLMLANKEKKP